MKYVPHGVIAAMTTPMTKEEEINELELRNQVKRFKSTGLHGLFCLGTNGEFFALTQEEKLHVIKIVIEENQGKLPVLAGTGCVTTRETVYLSQKAQELGATAVSVVTPYFGEVSQDKLISHFRTVAENIDIGVILYNIPARTGCSISYRTVEALAGMERIIGIKDSSGNFDHMLQYIEATGGQFPVLSGNDSLILPALLAGAAGGIAATANLFPNKVSDIYRKWEQGKLEEAWEIQRGIRPIRNCLKMGNPNSIIKRSVNLLGWPVGPVREPFGGDEEQWDACIREVLKRNYKGWD